MKSVSIIIVHYKTKDILFACLSSLYKYKNKTPFEVIIVDNDIENPIKSALLKKFPKVHYILSKENKGFGAGNNIGVKLAKGDYLFFLNPDTIVLDAIVDKLSTFLNSHRETAVVAPLLLDKNKKIYPLQGTRLLTPLNAIFSLSIIHKWFPNNPIAKRYWMADWNKMKDKEVEVAPGSAFMIKKDIFQEAGGFDEKIFLYFEEYDLNLRIKQLGYKIFITPSTKLIHLWGESTKQRNDLQKVFDESRYYYLKKHFGIFQVCMTELSFGRYKAEIIFFIILLVAAFLRFHAIQTLIPFFPDQGWFYLAAKNVVQTGHIPLVSITSSHTWLHQGPYWTYILAICLFLTNLNPVSGAYFTAGLDVTTLIVLYYATKKYFSTQIALIASSLYAVSPLVIVSSRTSYHTSPIPFFTVLFFTAVLSWVGGNKKIIPIIIGLLCILYNFEIATMSLTFMFIVLLIYGFWQKRPWASIFTRRNILLSITAYILTMSPMLLYDISHGFPETVKILLWILYKPVAALGIYRIHAATHTDWGGLFNFAGLELQRIIFMPTLSIAIVIFFSSLFLLTFYVLQQWNKKEIVDRYIALFLFIVIPCMIFLINGVLSDAYIPVLMPAMILIVAFTADYLFFSRRRIYIGLCILCIVIIGNIYSLLSSAYFTYPNMQPPAFSVFPLQSEKDVIAKIEKHADDKPFSIVPRDFGPESADNLVYLAQWMGTNYVPNAKDVYVVQPAKDLTSKDIVIYNAGGLGVTFKTKKMQK